MCVRVFPPPLSLRLGVASWPSSNHLHVVNYTHLLAIILQHKRAYSLLTSFQTVGSSLLVVSAARSPHIVHFERISSVWFGLLTSS